MFTELSRWPQKLKEGFELGTLFYEQHQARLPKNITKLAFVGMGGSGIAGRILKTFLDLKSKVTVELVSSPTPPQSIDGQTLSFVISYSGNTWETVDALEVLVAKFAPTVVLAHGGRALQLAHDKNLPFAMVPESASPRSALGNFLGFFCALFDRLGLLDGKDLYEQFVAHAQACIPKYEDKATFSDFLKLSSERPFFHIWGVSGYTDAVAYRAQTQFNENSKVSSVFSPFPECCHNLIVGYTEVDQNPLVVMCLSDFVPPHLQVALDATSELLAQKAVLLYKMPVLGDTFEKQVFNIILWSDYASTYLAQARGADPLPVHLIDELKTKHKDKGIT